MFVAHGVTAKSVARGLDVGQKVRVTLGLFAHHKEGGRHVSGGKFIQHPRRHVRVGTVVEGEMDRRVGVGRPFGPRPPQPQPRVGPSGNVGGPNDP